MNLHKKPEFSVREIMLKYVSYLPLFILSAIVSMGIGFIYIRYSLPLYKASASMIVKSGEDNSNTVSDANGRNDLIDNALFGGKAVNLDNEVELLRSENLIAKVVKRENFNIYYYDEGAIKRMDVYKDAPFKLIPLNIPDSATYYTLYVKSLSIKGGIVEAYNKSILFVWDSVINLNGFTFILRKNGAEVQSQKKYQVEWHPIKATTEEIQSELTVAPFSPKTSIISFMIKLENVTRGVDILNALIDEYRNQNIEDKNRTAATTINFINDRLGLITQELKDVEEALEKMRDKNEIYDTNIQISNFLGNANSLQKDIDAIQIQINVLGMVQEYLSKTTNHSKLVPSNLGIEDLTLKALIDGYNELQLKKEADEQQLVPGNIYLKELDIRLNELRQSMLENLKSIKKKYDAQLNDFLKKKEEIQSKIADIPRKERELEEIKRQQTIKANLYLYLLQKREETAISSSSTSSNYQQIDDAVGDSYPVEPKSSSIRLLSLLIGVAFPVIVIYLSELLNDKVTAKDDITQRTTIPIIGEVSHVEKYASMIMVDKSRDIVAEQFRIIRSNLSFLLNQKEKSGQTILVTSTMSGEGKSFASLNIAAVLSLSNKKVALLEFDLRKHRHNGHPVQSSNSKGISNYLIGQINDPADIHSVIERYPLLHIFQSGPIPPNPSELILHERVKNLFEWLKENYDYILIDSAPVGLVSDSFALNDYCDAVLYIIRQRFTFKRQLEFINQLFVEKKLTNMSLIINDVHVGGRYAYYGYGYNYRYGMQYGYPYFNRKYFNSESYFEMGRENYFDADKSKPWYRRIF